MTNMSPSVVKSLWLENFHYFQTATHTWYFLFCANDYQTGQEWLLMIMKLVRSHYEWLDRKCSYAAPKDKNDKVHLQSSGALILDWAKNSDEKFC